MTDQLRRTRPLIRPLEARDLVSCGALVEDSPLLQRYGFAGDRAMVQLDAARRDAGQLVLVAEGAEQSAAPLLGFAWLILRGGFGRSAYLRLILVDPRAAGQGVGGALLDQLERRHLAPAGLILLCSTDNSAARSFYERAGYQLVGELPDYVGPGLHESIYFKAAPAR